MKIEAAKRMMDAVYEAKRIWDQMPVLPEGINRSYIHVLDAVMHICSGGKDACVSDVSSYLGLPRPGVTRTVKDMEKKGLIIKVQDEHDARFVHLEATDHGRQLYETYVNDYFTDMTAMLSDISDEEADQMAATVHKIYELLIHDARRRDL